MSDPTTMRAIVQLASVPGMGPVTARRLLSRLESHQVALADIVNVSDVDAIQLLGFNGEQLQAFRRVSRHATELADRYLQIGIHLITVESAAVVRINPRLSPWFFARGNAALMDRPMIGFSGSRRATGEAVALTSAVAEVAALHGRVVVSGGARGVDTAAHLAAAHGHGGTIIVLPQGIDTWRPQSEIQSLVEDERVLVLSEFAPFDGWANHRAMQRNRTIVHLGGILVVPQAGLSGGTMNAATYALTHQTPVFVGRLNSGSEGNTALLERGAHPIPMINGTPDIAAMLELHTQTQATLF